MGAGWCSFRWCHGPLREWPPSACSQAQPIIVSSRFARGIQSAHPTTRDHATIDGGQGGRTSGQLQHPGTQMTLEGGSGQTRSLVETADPLGRVGDPVCPDHLAGFSSWWMLRTSRCSAVGVEHVDVMVRRAAWRHRQPGPISRAKEPGSAGTAFQPSSTVVARLTARRGFSVSAARVRCP